MASNVVKEKKSAKDFFAKIGRAISGFFKGIGSELKKVTWVTGKELFRSTVSVLVVCLVIGALIFGIDTLLKYLVDFVRPI